MSMISLDVEGTEIATRIANFVSHYGQLILALFILIALFVFYDAFVQSGIAKFLETADLRPPTIVH